MCQFQPSRGIALTADPRPVGWESSRPGAERGVEDRGVSGMAGGAGGRLPYPSGGVNAPLRA